MIKHPALRGHPLLKRGQGPDAEKILPSLEKRVPSADGGCFEKPGHKKTEA